MRVISTRNDWPTNEPNDADFWLVDSPTLWIPRYDDGRQWLGAAAVTDPERTARACFARDAALAQGIPWRRYTASHSI
ncbi:MAG: DUF6879 family protein [Sciscionella sp.]